MPRYHRFELALFAIAIGAIAIALVFAGYSWRPTPLPPSAAVDRGIAALRALDYAKARGDFTRAAKAGNVTAEIWLADMFVNGLGMAPDGNAAVQWLTRAANDGSAKAARRLGELYRDGRVVLQDLDAARLWLGRAAERGDAVAERELGALYAEGLGVRKDLVTAYQWLNLAARSGDDRAARARDRIAVQLSPDELRRGQDLAEQRLTALNAPRPARAATFEHASYVTAAR